MILLYVSQINLLSGWAQNIKDSMEQAALHIVNLFETHKAKS
jgi:hypothetical protein